MQCCTCSKWVDLRCSLLYSSKFNALENFHSWSCPPCCASAFLGGLQPSNTVASSSFSGPPSMYASIAQSVPLWSPLCQCSAPTLLSLTSILCSFCSLRNFSLHLSHTPMLLPVLLHLQLPLPPLNHSGLFNGISEVFEVEALNLSTSSRRPYLYPESQTLRIPG